MTYRDKSRPASRCEAGSVPVENGVSRRGFFATAAFGTTAALLLGLTKPAAAKTSQAAAQYQDSPHDKQHCALCNYFEPPHGCKMVAGDISPNGWCRFFQAKK